ncbi:MAG TPA: hypothetical protein VE934_12135 [Polaromonas sp.]|uniref:hypothetical protein n=1 Tax=Polaromonas sp. TaxID=1869339 RepID=UPI002D3C3FAF|nr:hypothetical protein [Polaromonas sp.]HYW57705.1 hypothetical protein [Polaromonas sp.]
MMPALEHARNAAGALAFAAIVSSADLLDQLTTLTGLSATVLLLITLAAVLAFVLGVIGWMSLQDVDDTLDYRTANRGAIERDTARLRRQVPHATTNPRPVKWVEGRGSPDVIDPQQLRRRFTVVNRPESKTTGTHPNDGMSGAPAVHTDARTGS